MQDQDSGVGMIETERSTDGTSNCDIVVEYLFYQDIYRTAPECDGGLAIVCGMTDELMKFHVVRFLDARLNDTMIKSLRHCYGGERISDGDPVVDMGAFRFHGLRFHGDDYIHTDVDLKGAMTDGQ